MSPAPQQTQRPAAAARPPQSTTDQAVRDNLPAIPVAPDHLPPAERAGRVMEAVIAAGDLGELNAQNRARYYVMLCQSLGLNPMTQPFQYITLNGKLTLYPRKEAAEQLGRAYNVSTEVTSTQELGDLLVVGVRATTPEGRFTDARGAVATTGLRGEALANALMKAESKAKRRAILSLIGLGWMDSGTGGDGDGSGVQEVQTDRHGNVAEPAPPAALPRIPVDQIGAIFGGGKAATPPAGVPDPLSSVAAAAPIAERQSSGRRGRPAPKRTADDEREMTGDELAEYFSGPAPGAAPTADSIDGEGRELPDEDELEPQAPEVRAICRELKARIDRLNPANRIELPPDDAPDEDWSSWHDENLAKVEAEEQRRASGGSR